MVVIREFQVPSAELAAAASGNALRNSLSAAVRRMDAVAVGVSGRDDSA
jgi:hypothetical protein